MGRSKVIMQYSYSKILESYNLLPLEYSGHQATSSLHTPQTPGYRSNSLPGSFEAILTWLEMKDKQPTTFNFMWEVWD